MRELHGVMAPHVIDSTHPNLKQRGLLFESLHVVGLNEAMGHLDMVLAKHASLGGGSNWPERRAELDYLMEKGFLVHEDSLGHLPDSQWQGLSEAEQEIELRRQLAQSVRSVAVNLERNAVQAVPVFDSVDQYYFGDTKCLSDGAHPADVLTIAMQALPVPGEGSAWDDILEFKKDEGDKQWAFRRFLHTLATKNQTEAEIRDDLEWSINEYSKAMELHRLKASNSFVDIFIITPLEIIENIAKFNWSKIAKGALQVNKRKIELMEAEAKAPGRECAYVFDARRRFSGGQG